MFCFYAILFLEDAERERNVENGTGAGQERTGKAGAGDAAVGVDAAPTAAGVVCVPRPGARRRLRAALG